LSKKLVHELKGIIVAMVTPLTPNGELDETTLKSHIKFLLENGVHGLFPCGSAGEGPKLTVDERKKMIDIVVAEADGKVPVIPGTGGITTDEAVRVTVYARDAGADAGLIVPPYYYHPSEKALYEHYETIAKRTDFPIVLYNIPSLAGYSLKPEFIARCIEGIPGIVAVKDSSYDMTKFEEILHFVGQKVSVLQGADTLILPSLLMGAKGAMVSDANVAPRLFVDIYEMFMRGDPKRAVEAQLKAVLLDRHLGYNDYVVSTKEALALIGRPVGPPRKPSYTISEEDKAQMKTILRKLGLLSM